MGAEPQKFRTFNVFAAELLHDLRREHSWRKSSPEDGVELVIEAADAHLAEVPVRVDDGLPHDLAFGLATQRDGRAFALFKDDAGVGDADANLERKNQAIVKVINHKSSVIGPA